MLQSEASSDASTSVRKKKKQTKVEATEVASLILPDHFTPGNHDTAGVVDEFKIITCLSEVPLDVRVSDTTRHHIGTSISVS